VEFIRLETTPKMDSLHSHTPILTSGNVQISNSQILFILFFLYSFEDLCCGVELLQTR
jgi:hypothetical protein